MRWRERSALFLSIKDSLIDWGDKMCCKKVKVGALQYGMSFAQRIVPAKNSPLFVIFAKR